MALLDIENLTVSFEGLRALEGVSFSVEQGELFSLVGPNGAGKTTVFNCISRICRQNSGDICFNGEEISKKKPHEIPRLGIARTFQNLELFHGMSALGNILLGCHIEARTRLLDALFFTRRLRRAETSAREAAEEVIDFLELEEGQAVAVLGSNGAGKNHSSQDPFRIPAGGLAFPRDGAGGGRVPLERRTDRDEASFRDRLSRHRSRAGG